MGSNHYANLSLSILSSRIYARQSQPDPVASDEFWPTHLGFESHGFPRLVSTESEYTTQCDNMPQIQTQHTYTSLDTHTHIHTYIHTYNEFRSLESTARMGKNIIYIHAHADIQ